MLNTIFTMMMPFVTILSPASAFSGERICRLCALITRTNRQASTSDEFSAAVIYGSRNTRLTI